MSKAMLIDTTRCIGCRGCQVACKSWHNLPGERTVFSETWSNPRHMNSSNYTRIIFREVAKPEGKLNWYFIKRQCMHCLDPACVSVCPVGALTRLGNGPVVYEDEKCIGCRYCMMACPFNIPRYEWNKPVPAVRKCDMCIDRQREGKKPACAEACPKGATVFGTRQELIAEAWSRIKKSPRDYHLHVYGEHEVGGTSVLFLVSYEVATLGYKAGLGNEPLPQLTWQVLSKLPGIGVVSGAALMAIWWITRRRDEVALAEGRHAGNGRTHEGRN